MTDAVPAVDEILVRREAGILLHPTSLPGGTIGAADQFLEFLSGTGCRVWQMLPLGPPGGQMSPYSPISVFAGNTALLPSDAASRSAKRVPGFPEFVEREQHWLPDYALFVALKNASHGKPWWEWPAEARNRRSPMLETLRRRHADEIDAACRAQFAFAEAWKDLHESAKGRGICLYGDLPMFPVTDSADVWANREIFKLDRDGIPRFTAGVPPDAFAVDGQHWGNPVFDWRALAERDFSWWRERVRHELRRVDLLRWDHFRGLIAAWEIPRVARTAREGKWRKVPGRKLLGALAAALGPLPIIAENLGVITPEVEALRHDFGFPGMHVMQFAFDGTPDNPHLPERHEEQGVAYTGTHDNDTTLGWFRSLDEKTRRDVLDSTGGSDEDMPWPLIEAALGSRARLAVIPMQDFLALDSSHRMNRPGIAEGNWTWRLEEGVLTPDLAERIARAVEASRRAPVPSRRSRS